MKTKISFFLILCSSILLFTSCSTPEKVTQRQIDEYPLWYTTPPGDTDEYLYVSAQARSSRHSIAQERANLAANRALADKLGLILENIREDFEQEISSDEQASVNLAFANTTKTVTSQKLIGVSQEDLVFIPTPDGGVRALILVKLPVGAAKTNLLNVLSQEKEMYVRFQQSQAFERLNKSMQDYFN